MVFSDEKGAQSTSQAATCHMGLAMWQMLRAWLPAVTTRRDSEYQIAESRALNPSTTYSIPVPRPLCDRRARVGDCCCSAAAVLLH